MDITYFGHSCFKLRGKTGTVVTDPFDKSVGLPMPKLTADIVTISHHHHDHDHYSIVGETMRKKHPFVIDSPGEYELFDISIFGIPSFHDTENGERRGGNMISIIHLDALNVVHLGDLGHELADRELERLGVVDVLLLPVGGFFTVGAKEANRLVEAIEPSIVIPMHYKTEKHSSAFSSLSPVDDFLKEMGKEGIEPQDKLTVTAGSLPSELEIVVLRAP